MKKKLPAYARPIVDARRAGMVPARREVVVILDAWRPVMAGERVVVPPGDPITDLEWSFLRRLGVIVVWCSSTTDGERVMDLARAILAVDPTYLLIVDTVATGTRKIQWIKTLANGVEVTP